MNSDDVKKSLIGKILPYDLIEYIWSLNYDWAAKIIQNKVKKSIINKINYLSYLYNTSSHVILNIYNKNHYILCNEILNTMNLCKCCARHQINKPNKLEPWEELPFQFTHINNNECFCSCRHISRMICRYIEE